MSAARLAVAALERRVVADGALAQRLVEAYDRMLARQEALRQQLAAAELRLRSFRRAAARLAVVLRADAIDAYISSAGTAPGVVALTGPASSSPAAAAYAGAAANEISELTAAYRLDEHRVAAAGERVRRQVAAAEASLVQLSVDRNEADSAIGRDDALLAGARGELKVALVAAAARQAQVVGAAELAMSHASRFPASLVAAAELPSGATGSATGLYENPLRGLAALTPERIDQGVDFSAFGPIYALGDAIVLSTVNGGWPAGTYISYRLLDGPAAGLVVYAAEDIDPLVRAGQSVTSSTVLGLAYEGPNGFETGWAYAGSGESMGRVAGQFSGANSTVFGANFSALLVSLGAPAGVEQPGGSDGALPVGWPRW